MLMWQSHLLFPGFQETSQQLFVDVIQLGLAPVARHEQEPWWLAVPHIARNYLQARTTYAQMK